MINEEFIKRAEEKLTDMAEGDFNKYLKRISKEQPIMVGYVMAMGDIFEDEEEYFNKYVFYYTLIHRAYNTRFRAFPKIDNSIIDEIEERDEEELSALIDVDEEKLEETMISWIKAHPQKALLSFFYDDLFGTEDEFDDLGEELDSQIFFLLVTIVNIYEEALVRSQKKRKA
ncbi:MAG: hypothetical protein DSY76_05030 [Bacteroidetes bacterium]|nr:MAG: hypothetical protein DSY76_05030 [Bacteroidota bacterium]